MRLKSAPLYTRRERSRKIADTREDVGGGSGGKEQPIHTKSRPTYQWVVRIGKVHERLEMDAQNRYAHNLWRSDADMSQGEI